MTASTAVIAGARVVYSDNHKLFKIVANRASTRRAIDKLATGRTGVWNQSLLYLSIALSFHSVIWASFGTMVVGVKDPDVPCADALRHPRRF